MKGALRRLEGREYDTELEEAKKELRLAEAKLDAQTRTCQEIDGDIADLQKKKGEVDGKIDSIPTEMIDIAKVKADIRQKRVGLTTAQKNLEGNKKTLKDKKALLAKITEFIENYDIDNLMSKKAEANKITMALLGAQKDLTILEEKVSSLSDPGFLRGCKCLHEAEKAQEHGRSRPPRNNQEDRSTRCPSNKEEQHFTGNNKDRTFYCSQSKPHKPPC
jgi:hypothetical protein